MAHVLQELQSLLEAGGARRAAARSFSRRRRPHSLAIEQSGDLESSGREGDHSPPVRIGQQPLPSENAILFFF